MKQDDLLMIGAVGLGLYALNQSGILGGAGKVTNAAGDLAQGVADTLTGPMNFQTPEFQESLTQPPTITEMVLTPPVGMYKLHSQVQKKIGSGVKKISKSYKTLSPTKKKVVKYGPVAAIASSGVKKLKKSYNSLSPTKKNIVKYGPVAVAATKVASSGVKKLKKSYNKAKSFISKLF